jgi:hypothetical protein
MVLAFSTGCGDSRRRPLEHDDLERCCGVPWHRADLGFFGAHALSRCARVARMDSCGPLLATHFLLEKQVEARAHGASGTSNLWDPRSPSDSYLEIRHFQERIPYGLFVPDVP